MKKHFKAVELKHLDDETIMKIREWRNNDFVRKMSYNQDVISLETHMQFIDDLRNDKNRGLFIFYLEDEPFAVYQYLLNPSKGYVKNSHYLIKEEYQNLGYGTLLSYFELEIIFYVLNYSKSYGEVLEYNKNVISMNKKMGATLEKVMKKEGQSNGEKQDVYCFSVCKDSWEKSKQRYQKIINILVDDFDIERDIIY